jgi:hypothetical protein
LLEWAKVELPVSTSGGYPEARTLETDRDTLLFVFNHDKQAVDASICLRARGDLSSRGLGGKQSGGSCA